MAAVKKQNLLDILILPLHIITVPLPDYTKMPPYSYTESLPVPTTALLHAREDASILLHCVSVYFIISFLSLLTTDK